MKRLMMWAISAALLAAGCGAPAGLQVGAAGPRVGQASVPAAGQDPAGVLPNLPYQFLGPQALVVRYEVPEAKARALLDPVFQPEVRNGKASVFAIAAEYHAAAVVGAPAVNLRAREITYTVLCGRTGKNQDRTGFATFRVVEDQRLFSWLIRDVGYPVTTLPLPWVRSGDHLTSTGEADFDLVRKTDVISHVERSASLTKLMVGKHDHLAKPGEITEVPLLYPIPVLDGYGVRAARLRFGTLEKLGLVAPDDKPAEIWWWEGQNFIVGKREHYPAH